MCAHIYNPADKRQSRRCLPHVPHVAGNFSFLLVDHDRENKRDVQRDEANVAGRHLKPVNVVHVAEQGWQHVVVELVCALV